MGGMVTFLTLPAHRCLIYGSNPVGSGVALLPACPRRIRGGKGLKKTLAFLFALSLAGTAFAQRDVDTRAGSLDKTADDVTAAPQRHFPVNPDGTSRQDRMIDEIDHNKDEDRCAPRNSGQQMRVIAPEAV